MMLTTRRHIEAIAVFTLTLQLVLSLPASADLVLCVGSDGHVAVEGGGPSGCGPLGQPAKIGCDELGYPAPCSDAPLDNSQLVSGASPRAGDSDASLALAPVFALSSPPVAAASTRPLATAVANPSSTHRRVILRL